MAKRHKEWARRARAKLRVVLGDKCARCPATEKLEFDCITPCGDRHHRMDTSARMSFYHAQHRAGNLQLLCEKCNNSKSHQEKERHPF